MRTIVGHYRKAAVADIRVTSDNPRHANLVEAKHPKMDVAKMTKYRSFLCQSPYSCPDGSGGTDATCRKSGLDNPTKGSTMAHSHSTKSRH